MVRRRILTIASLALVMAFLGTAALLAISHAGGFTGVQWTQIGPAPLAIDAGPNNPTKFQGKGPVSGQVQDIAIDPRNTSDQVMYIATQDGGIWKSSDGGSTWKPKTDFLNSLSAGAVALDAGNPSIVYYGTGELVNQGFFKAVGLYKSTDGGDTWTLLNPGNVFTPANGGFCVNNSNDSGQFFGFGGPAIIRIVSPSPNTILVATSYGLFRSTDGGATFTSVLAANTCVSDLELDTTAANTVFAAVDGNAGNNGNIDPSKNNGKSGIFESTDGGATWSSNLLTSGNGAPTTNVAWITFSQTTKPNNNTIYFTSSDYRGPTAGGVTGTYPFLGLFKSANSGTNWSQVSTDLPAKGCQCGYDQAISVDPTDATGNTLYIGFQHIFKSTNGGTNFTDLTPSNPTNQVHNDHHIFLFSPSSHSPIKLYDGSDGGIAVTPDGGTTFYNINGTIDPNTGLPNGATQGIATNLFRAIDIGRGSSTNNQYSYGGMQDTGTAEFAPGFSNQTWEMGIDGDGSPVVVDPAQPKTVFGVDDGQYMFSTDAGHTWNFPTAASTNLTACPGAPPAGSCAQPVAIDFNNDKNVYAINGKQLFRSNDGGNTFTSIQTFAQNISAVSPQVKLDSNVLYVGLSDGTLQFSSNVLAATPTFAQTAATPAHLNKQGVASIAIDPSNTQTAVITYNGFCGNTCNNNPNQHVFRTTDGGTTWNDITGTVGGGLNNLPDLPVHSVVIDQNTTPHTIIVGNDAGVLQTADNGLTWQVLGLGMPTVDVVTVALDAGATPDLLRAGTYGRSVFELGAAQGPLLAINSTFNFGTLCPGQTPTELLQLFNVGTSDLTISSISRVAGSSDFTLTGPSFPVTIKVGEEVDFTVSFTPKLANEGTTETATFQIDSNDAVNPNRQIIYTATVGAPNGSTVIANGGDFGNICVGSFADLNLTIANKGTCDLLVSGITSSDADFLPPSTLVYPLAVHTGTSVAAPVRFEPLSPGAKAGIITVDSSNNPSGNMSVNVIGNAPPGHITVSGSGSFGNVCAGGANGQQTITVANTGPCNLHVTGASINCPDFTIEGNPFPAIISADASLPLTIKFTPTSIGPKSCTLTITSDDPANPTVTIPLTATTPAVSIDVPPDAAPFGYNFPATVIQSVGACSSKNPFPVSNNGSCPTTITAVTIGPSLGLPGSDPADYSLAGLPSLSTPLQSGHILGEGDLSTVFKPTLITRAESAAVTVTWESDPITHATTSVSRNLCGEGTSRGARVLVTAGGVPLTSVDKIQLHRLNSNRKSISIDNVNNAPLQTVTQTAPCASFSFQREWGGVTNPIQLTAGDYQITVTATVNNKKVSKTVSFTLETCSFNQNIVVAF